MKIKIFSNPLYDELEKEVNEFLQTCWKFVDVKFVCDISKYSAMIVYEE